MSDQTSQSVTSRVATLEVDRTFARITTGPVVTSGGFGCAWGDYDNDGWLDLSVSFSPKCGALTRRRYMDLAFAGQNENCWHSMRNDAANFRDWELI